MSFDAFDVVVVPFPFTDQATSKRRPALVLSDSTAFNDPVGRSVLAMITSATHSPWPLDVEIHDLGHAGLPSASLVRMKLFTLDHELIIRKAGALSEQDRTAVSLAVKKLLDM